MSINASDSFPPAPVIDGLDIYGDNNPTFTGSYTNLGLIVFRDQQQNGTYDIQDSEVFIGTSGTSSDSDYGYINATFTGHITTLTCSAYNSPQASELTLDATVNEQVDNLSLMSTSSGAYISLSTYQTAPLTISNWGVINASALTFYLSAPSVTSLTVPSSMSGYGSSYFYYNGAFDVASVEGILQSYIEGNSYGIDLSIGGTSASPVVTPEIDVLTFTSPTDGDSWSLNFNGNLLGQVIPDASIPFASSVVATGQLGIQDSPTMEQIAGFVADSYNAQMTNASYVASGATVIITDSLWGDWPISLYSPWVALNNIQTGIDLVAQLASLDNTVSTN